MHACSVQIEQHFFPHFHYETDEYGIYVSSLVKNFRFEPVCFGYIRPDASGLGIKNREL